MSEEQATDVGSTTRRALIAGVGAAGASAVLAGCGTSPDSGSNSAGSDASSNPGQAASGAAADAGAGAVLADVKDIPVGGGAVFADQKIVVTQPTKNHFRGFSAVCTHAGCTVTEVSGGTINCACHNTKFAITDGEVKEGPAKKPLPRAAIEIQDGSKIVVG